MTSKYREIAEGMAQDVIGKGKEDGNGTKKAIRYLSIIISSFIIGGFVFDWIGGIVKKEITVKQNVAMIEVLKEQVKLMQEGIQEQKIEYMQFQTEVLERLKKIDESAETRGHILWDLDKWRDSIEEWKEIISQQTGITEFRERKEGN